MTSGAQNERAPWSQNTTSNAFDANGNCSPFACDKYEFGVGVASVKELRAGDVERGDVDPALGERNRPLGRAATEFEHAALGEIAQHIEFGFRHAVRTPRQRFSGQRVAVRALVRVSVGVPKRSVVANVIGHATTRLR